MSSRRRPRPEDFGYGYRDRQDPAPAPPAASTSIAQPATREPRVSQRLALSGNIGRASAGLLENEGETAGVLVSGEVPDTWASYLNLGDPDHPVFKHEALTLAQDGSATFSGALSAPSGEIGGWTIGADDLSSGGVKLQSAAERILLGAATAPLTGTGVFIGLDGADYEMRAGDPGGAYIHWNGSALTIIGALLQSPGTGTDPALLGWGHDMAFSATDHDTVAWGSGTIRLQNGVTYSISAGNTGAMAGVTYIYLDAAVSLTVLQTTATQSGAVGANRILVAVAAPVASGKSAEFQVFGGSGGVGVSKLFTRDNIAADTLTGNEVVANTLTAAHIASLSFSGKNAVFDNGSVGGWTMSSGTLSAGSVTISASAERLLLGAATAPLTGVGVFLGKDGADYEFRAGNPAGDHIHWDGSSLNLSGAVTATSGTIGGWTIASTQLSSGSVKLQAGAERILLGAATAPLTGVGIFVGKDGSDYEFRAGDPSGHYIHWDGSALTIKGTLDGVDGTFSGELSGASGTFAGDLSAAGGTFSGELSAATGSFAGSLSAATGTFAGDLSAAGGTFSGSLSAASGTFGGTVSAGGTIAASNFTATTASFAGISISSTATFNDLVRFVGSGNVQVEDGRQVQFDDGSSVTGVMRGLSGRTLVQGNFEFEDNVGFYGTTPISQPQTSGALSAVADANARAVLNSIVFVLDAFGLAVDNTT